MMNTTDQPTTQPAPILDETVLAISFLRDRTFAQGLPYMSEVFKAKEFPIAHARKIIAMCMGEELGGNPERIKFLRLVFGVVKSSDLAHDMLSGLWHWLKPWQSEDGHWHANEDAGKSMRAVIRESVDGTWTHDDGHPTQATF